MTGFDVGLAIAIASALLSVLAWYRSLTRSQYAREREYSHILKGLEQTSQSIHELFKDLSSDHKAIFRELDEAGDRLSRLEIIISTAIKRVGGE